MLERKPSWLMRWGLLTIVFLIGLLFVFSAFINFPETIEYSAVIIHLTSTKIPANETDLNAHPGAQYIAVFYASEERIKRIKIGQSANLKVRNGPDKGHKCFVISVEKKITSINEIDMERTYVVTLQMLKPLHKDYIKYNNSEARVRIVIRERSLLQALISGILKMP